MPTPTPTSVPAEPLAIVGIGCLFPKSAGPGYFWANVKHGVDCIGEVPTSHWNPDDYYDPDPKRPDMTYARRGGFLDVVDFNPLEFGIAPRDIEATDTTQLLGLVAAKQALTDAGVVVSSGKGESSPKAVDRSRISVILGVTGTLELVIPLGARLGHPKWKRAMKAAGIPDDLANDAAERIAESYVPWQENSFPGLLGNVVAGRIANRLDLGGTNCVVDAACASSLSAVHLASLELQAKRADVVVSGGCDTFNDIFMYMCFSKTPALSPSGDAKPFDANGDGTILGEGLGVVVLKRLADAERAGDTIYAVLKGIGSSSDGKGNAIYAPSAAGQKNCLRNAYAIAGVTPDTIELVEAHGTGTKVGDATEAMALTEVFGTDATSKPRPWCALGSVKSQVGHTKAAAGAASLIKTALALYFKVLPPTIKVKKPVEPLGTADSPFYVNTQMRPWLPRAEHPRRAALSAFGFGGSNFHAVLEEHQGAKLEVDWDGSVELLALGADSAQTLAAELARVPTSWAEFARFAERSRAAFDVSARCRLCFAAHRTASDPAELIASAKARLQAEPEATEWHTPEGVYYGSGPAPGKLAVLFPGQGSQSVGMLRELACLFPEMLDSLAAANAAVEALANDASDSRRLSDRVYPSPTFETEQRRLQDADLRETRNAQPALGAVSFGAWRVLSERFGVQADAFAGHSYGELVALAAGGRIAASDLWPLSRLRGQLMGEQRSGDRGAMLAVLAPISDVERIIAAEKLDLTVANHNSPRQVVLSGGTPEIERAARVLGEAGIRSSRLPVAAAFHSPFVSEAALPFRAALESIAFASSSVPVFANTTAREYPADGAAARDLLANQLAKPVAFVEQIQAMIEAGAKTFVEVGPASVLTRLVEATLASLNVSGVSVFAIEHSAGKRSGVLELVQTLCWLAARGHGIDLAAWEKGSRCRPAASSAKPGLTIALTGANYVTPRPARPPRTETPLPNGTARLISAKGARNGLPASPAKVVAMPDTDPNAIAQALLMTQQSLAALQRMQEQTAALHKQFLDSQEGAQRTFQALVEQQQSLLLSGLGVSLPPIPIAPPIPAPAATFAPPAPPVSSSRAIPPAAPRFSPTPSPASITPPPAVIPKPAPVAAAAPPVAPASAPSHRIASTLLAVVAEKTGYPVESLDLSLSLDNDLGVDSIKRVEILSTLQERLPDAPIVKPEHLGTLHTLRDVVAFLSGAPSAGTNGDGSYPGANEADLMQTMQFGKEQLLLMSRPEAAIAALAPPASRAPGGTTGVATVLLQVVSEKTGYPVDSLDLSLTLDNDLGVDSIKRVEILSTLQERLPDAPTVKPEHLGTLSTLRDVAEFLAARTTIAGAAKIPIHPVALAPAGSAEVSKPLSLPSASPPELAAPETEQISNILPPVVTESVLRKSGVQRQSGTVRMPPARHGADSASMANQERVDRSILQSVDLDLTTPRTRIPLAAGGEIWIVGHADPLTAAVAEMLAAQDYNVKVFKWSEPGPGKPALPLSGLLLLAPPAADPEPRLNRLAFDWLKQAGPKLRQAGRGGAAVFATVARLDGAFGLADLSPEADPTAGGLAGLVKTARHEWPEVYCKAIDLAASHADPQAAGAALVEELLAAGPTEVGIAPTHRCALELARTVRRPGAQPLGLSAKDVILLTGGARGVTAEAALALAEAYPSTLILTGRTQQPGPEPEWLSGLTIESEIKRAIAEKLGPGAGPKPVGEQYLKVSSQREVRRTLDRIGRTGAKVAYFPVDITDGKAVADMLQQVRVKHGPVTALVHGAGVLADKRLEELGGEQFDYVYSTKVDGLRNLLDLLAPEELKALVLFSSTTARFGRTGQAAYACANEVLNKTAQVEARRRPGCRVMSINWGPWDGGMVTPQLRKVFESEGIGLIPLTDGGRFLVNELSAAGKAVEVIALARHRASGVIPVPTGMAAAAAPAAAPGPQPRSPSGSGTFPSVSAPSELTVAFERTVDVTTHPVLAAHAIEGRAVLPMALHLEWLAHAAMHGNPGLLFHGFNELRITDRVTIDPGAAIQLKAFAGKATKQDKAFAVPVELRGKKKDGREVIHSRAEILLVLALPSAPLADKPPPVTPLPYSVPEAYREQLFHGPELHGIERIEGASETAFIATAFPAPAPADWLLAPLRSNWVADPLVLDASFQMMILWTRFRHSLGSLPWFAGRYRQYFKAFPADPTTVVIRVRRDDGKFARADLDYLDPDGRVIAQMQDYECVMEKTAAALGQRNPIGVRR